MQAGGSEPEQAATTGAFGEFSVTLHMTDNAIALDSVATEQWGYDITDDDGIRMTLKLYPLGGHDYEWKVRAFIGRCGTLRTRVVDIG